MVEHDLLIDQVLVVFFLQTVYLEVKVKYFNKVCCWLVVREVELAHVRMGQSFVNGDPLQWVEGQHPFDQVNRFCIGSFEDCVEVLSLSPGQFLDELFVLGKSNLFD